VTVVVGNKSLIIEGGFDTCQFANPDIPADLSGNGSSPVITIQPTGSAATQVTLHGLKIHGGGDGSVFGSYGGGVNVSGNTFVAIDDTTIQNNSAFLGGGISIVSGVPYPTVQLNPGVKIIGNHAGQAGGGVYLDGGTLGITADRVNIDNNTAGSNGGGIMSYQGLIYVGNPQQAPARHDVTGASISGNSAAIGGGIYLATATQLIAYELILDSNTAINSGGGIGMSGGAYVFMARDYPNAAYEFQCPNALQCSRISNNSVGAGAAQTIGGGIALYSGAYADVAQTVIRGNIAQNGSAVYMDDGNKLNMEGVLIAGNQSNESSGAGPAIRVHTSTTASQLRIAYTTFADNYVMPQSGPNHLADDVIAIGGTQLSIFKSAFYDLLDVNANSAFTDDCTVSSFSNAGSAYGTYTRALLAIDPGFVNAAAGDYRPQSNSALVDYCDSSGYVAGYRDIQLTPRCNDDPGKTNTYGTCDVGAYEYSDRIFGDGFE
jgi:hypothetical protein